MEKKLNTLNFNPNKLTLSHNGQYIMCEDILYDISNDKSYNTNNLEFSFWLNFLKENSKESYRNGVKSLNDLQKIIRESIYSLSDIFDKKSKDLFIFEFERKFSNRLVTEGVNVETNINTISSSWDYIIESFSNYVTLKEESENKGFLSNLTDKIKSGTNQLMEKGLGWFFENLRKALFSWGGAAIQTFLSTMTSGLGNVVLVVVWGAMLAWDLSQGINGNWDWVKIIIDLVGVVTTGPGAKVITGVFKRLGILGTKLPLSGIIKKMSSSGSSMVKWFSSVITKIVSGLSRIGSYMLQGVSWLSKKLGIKSLDKVSGQLRTKLNNVVNDIVRSSSGLKQKGGQSSDLIKTTATNVGNKFSSAGNLLKTRGGRVATSTGLTAGITSATGGDLRTFGGAFEKNNTDIDFMSQFEKSFGNIDDLEFEL
jgi:hypothetical protein